MGLSASPSAHHPPGQNNCIFIHATDAIYLLTDNGGTETSTSINALLTGEHTYKIVVSSGGGNVKGYIDGVLEGTHTTNITSSTALSLVMGVYSNGSSEVFDIADFIAFREA